jgi:hypothetical protein
VNGSSKTKESSMQPDFEMHVHKKYFTRSHVLSFTLFSSYRFTNRTSRAFGKQACQNSTFSANTCNLCQHVPSITVKTPRAAHFADQIGLNYLCGVSTVNSLIIMLSWMCQNLKGETVCGGCRRSAAYMPPDGHGHVRTESTGCAI